MLAKSMNESMGQTVVIDHKPGASGNIGTTVVARSPADGYTLLLTVSSMATNAAFDLGIDPIKNLAPIARFAVGPMLLVVNNQFPAKTPSEFIAQLKSNSGKFNYGSSGIGSAPHLLTELILGSIDATATHVPYQSSALTIPDLLTNRVQFLITAASTATAQLRSGQLRAIAVTSPQRSEVVPGVPPLKMSWTIQVVG